MSLYFNGGAGSFAPRKWFDTGPYPLAIGSADLDGDARPDLVTVDDFSMISVLMNRCLP